MEGAPQTAFAESPCGLNQAKLSNKTVMGCFRRYRQLMSFADWHAPPQFVEKVQQEFQLRDRP
jgi:hypothetical protein